MNAKLSRLMLLVSLVAFPGVQEALAAGKKTVLIYGKTFGFRHKGAIDKGSPILKQVAEGLGYAAVISEDPAVFDADQVKKWDVIVFNNCTGGLNPKEPERREALMARIKDGAGFMGFHAATDCNTQWPEYGKMINGYFWGHPWNQKVESKVEDPDHPLMKAFKGGPFVIKDEIYQFRDYDRSAVRVLMSIDTRSVPVSRGRRKDRDYAICWIRPWDKGRVYYNAHGHAENVFQDKIFQEHLKPAMQWAAGDIEVDTTPSKAIDTAALAAGAVDALKKATDDKARIAALDILSWAPREDALPLILAQLDVNQEVAAVAADAAQAIVAKSAALTKDRKIDILKKVLPLATSRDVRKTIREQLKGLGVTDIPINVPPGYIAHWFIAGPLPNPQPHKGYDTAYPPEQSVDLAAGFEAGGKKLAWKKVETDDDGILDLNANIRRASNVLGYMFAEITVAKETPVEIRLGSDDGYALFVNGKKLDGKKTNRALKPASDKVKATLTAGANQVLLKVIQGGGDWSGCLQIVGADGKKVEFTERKK